MASNPKLSSGFDKTSDSETTQRLPMPLLSEKFYQYTLDEKNNSIFHLAAPAAGG